MAMTGDEFPGGVGHVEADDGAGGGDAVASRPAVKAEGEQLEDLAAPDTLAHGA